MMRKNEQFSLYIEDMSVDGAGIGHKEGMTFFVKDAVVGDTITAGVTKLKKTYGYARLVSVDIPSADRVEPFCPVARTCGGCTIQALSYEKQLEMKASQVKNALMRIGGLDGTELKEAAEDILGMDEPRHFRNKAQYPIGEDKDGRIVIGYYAAHSHRIVELPESGCGIGQTADADIIRAVREYMTEERVRAYDERTGQGLLRHLLIRCAHATGEIMVCLVATQESLPQEERLVERLRRMAGVTSVCLNYNKRRDNVIMGESTRGLWGRKTIRDVLCGITFAISARSFYQVNPIQTEKLYRRAIAYADLHGEEIVWDLYCGIGTISLCMAKQAKWVYGIEVVPDAVADARANARENGIENVTFAEGRAEDILRDDHSTAIPRPDVVVVDPPRKGLDETTIGVILKAAPQRIVYVSCNPSTLARDVRLLLAEGDYKLCAYTPVDQFGFSGHVETVVLMSRKDT